MTTIIAYHRVTTEVALLLSDDGYWIGSYSKFCRHQNGEPPYIFIEGFFEDDVAGKARLAEMTGEEF